MSDWAIVSIVVVVGFVVLALAIRRRITGIEMSGLHGIKAKVTATADQATAGTEIERNELDGDGNSIRSFAPGSVAITRNRLSGKDNAIEVGRSPPPDPPPGR
jgi:hypothetical protein